MKWLFCALLGVGLSAPAMASTREFCGKRDGTAGNAALVDQKGNEVIELAVQGEGTKLLDEADALVGKNSGVAGESGTQNGKSYCVTAELDAEGQPVKIVKAKLKK